MKIPPAVDINEARVAVAALLFGTSGVAAQLLAPGLPAATTAGWRVVLGGAVLVGFSTTRGQAPWKYPLRWRVTLLGAIAFLVFQLGFFLSVSLAGIATATIVTIGTGPVVAGLLDRARRGTPLRRRWWIGVGVAVLGIAVTTGAGAVTLNPAGWASAMIAGCCFPVFGSAIRDLTTDRPTVTAAATVFGVAIIPAAVLLAVAGSNPAATAGSITALVYLGVVTTAIAYALWSAGPAGLTLANTVTLTMLEPVAATVLAIAILGEPAGPTTILGIATTLAGVWTAATVRSGQFAAPGTVRGETAAPDPRHARPSRGPARAGCTLPAVSAILHEAVAVGNAASRTLVRVRTRTTTPQWRAFDQFQRCRSPAPSGPVVTDSFGRRRRAP